MSDDIGPNKRQVRIQQLQALLLRESGHVRALWVAVLAAVVLMFIFLGIYETGGSENVFLTAALIALAAVVLLALTAVLKHIGVAQTRRLLRKMQHQGGKITGANPTGENA